MDTESEVLMRFVLCIVVAALLPAFALAQQKGGAPMSVASTQAAAAKGDQNAAAALAMTTSQETCMSGCESRGYPKHQCVSACRPGLCHPAGEQPYCVK
jgi:hypothetical protein